jgi:hypothetical protein
MEHKSKVTLPRYHKGERRYSSYSFLTSELNVVCVVSVTPRTRFTTGKGPSGTH